MNPFWGGVLAGCLFIFGCSLAALGLLVAADVRSERREREATKRRHPSSQSVATYLVGERRYPREMPPEFRAWIIEQVEQHRAEQAAYDAEWDRIVAAYGDQP